MTAHDPKRRAALVRALVEIVADRGLDAVSVREVAAHVGVSIGAVQHHFPTKSAMLRAAMDDVSARWVADVERDLPEEPRAALRLVAERLVPVATDDRDARVWFAFVARAAVDDELAAVHREGMRELEHALVAAAVDGVDDDAERAAVADELAAVLALVDGLTVAVLLEPDRMPPHRAHAIVNRYLDGLFATP